VSSALETTTYVDSASQGVEPS